MTSRTAAFRFPWRIFSRIAFIQAFLVLLALAASGLSARFFFKRHFLSQMGVQLTDVLQALGPAIPAMAPTTPQVAKDWCTRHAAQTSVRLTLIRRDGVVLCDSHHDSGTMENHAGRPEVVE